MVDGVMTIRRTLRPAAEALATCSAKDQERFLDSVGFVAATSLELAYNFCAFAIPAFRRMDPAAWPAWVVRILDLYDEGGTLAAITAMKEAAASTDLLQMRPGAVELSEVSRVLEGILHGLEGRRLRIEAGEPPWTDTDTVYLPPVLARGQGREANFRLYKAMAVHLWAQVRYGTWSVGMWEQVAGLTGESAELTALARLEAERLQACIARDLPGLGRELRGLTGAARLPRGWAERLADPAADVTDSIALAREAARRGLELEPLPFQGVLRPERVRQVHERRIGREKVLLRKWLRHLLDQEGKETGAFRVEPRVDDERCQVGQMELLLDGRPVAPPPELRTLMDSVVLDLGSIPPEYLVPAGPGAWSPQEAAVRPDTAAAGDAPFVYDEWDYQRQRYRKDWCRVCEPPVPPRDDGFVEETLRAYRPLLHRLHHGFEALRDAQRRLRRQAQGDDVDLDALVDAWVDLYLGHEMSDRLFVRSHKRERDVAVLFMVDVSGSTDGWVNRVERESLVLLCEALERLGDRYAIYGFSGFTHRRCELYPVKRFEEPYDDTVRGRIAGLRPRDYTRMGAAIRHTTGVLSRVEARTRLLVTLSDGRPDDQDGYRGPYGIEDTRKALLEARAAGIHPFCITIDKEAQDYLPHMYGPTGFTIVDQIERLPFKVSDVYRRLTF
ncbi:MAG TPA: VWA domain-containing protein [Thiotrichales bacterium]|nr:VWA domain-containing protein [Thiotrichales bacterium]